MTTPLSFFREEGCEIKTHKMHFFSFLWKFNFEIKCKKGVKNRRLITYLGLSQNLRKMSKLMMNFLKMLWQVKENAQ